MNTRKATVAMVLAAMFLTPPNQADAKAKPKSKASKSKWGKATIDTKDLSTPEFDLKTAGK